MPQPNTYFEYAVRTDKEFEKVKKYIEDLAHTTGWAVREVAGDNEHWHWYVRTPRKIQSFRVNLTKAVPEIRGNGGYSCADCRDTEKYWRYMAKGEPDIDPEVVWKIGQDWTDERIHQLHIDYWTENAKIKKRRVGSVQDHVIDVCKRDGVAWDDVRQISKEYVKELLARSKPINTFAVKSAVRLIQCVICPNEEAVEQVVNLCI